MVGGSGGRVGGGVEGYISPRSAFPKQRLRRLAAFAIWRKATD